MDNLSEAIPQIRIVDTEENQRLQLHLVYESLLEHLKSYSVDSIDQEVKRSDDWSLRQVVDLDILSTIEQDLNGHSSINYYTELVETEFNFLDSSLLLAILEAIMKVEDLGPWIFALWLHENGYMA